MRIPVANGSTTPASPQRDNTRSIVTDGLRAYSAAMNEMGVAAEWHEVGARLNNPAENSHQPRSRCISTSLRYSDGVDDARTGIWLENELCQDGCR